MDTRPLRIAPACFLGLLLLGVSALGADISGLKSVPLTDPGISVHGARFAQVRADGLHFDRFDATILEGTLQDAKVSPARARTTSGVIVSLASRAPHLRLHFRFDPKDENRGSQFGIYRDGQWVREVAATGKTPDVVVDVEGAAAAARVCIHEVVLPSWSNPILQKLEITETAALEKPSATKRGRIVFLGDSITHGTGQGSASYKNYPFIAASKLGMEGFNLAVGGGKISPPVANLLRHFGPVDVVWILVGYNNWQGAGQDIATITTDYDALLATVRRHQPDAQVYCCTLTYTRNTANQKTGVTAAAVREAVTGVVSRRITAGDRRLHLVHGEQFTDEACLRASDPVHFSEAGAARFADIVVRVVRSPVATAN